MRKYYIDNIRILCILLLIPFHTCMLFNDFGEPFYVLSRPVAVCSDFVVAVYPWWMTLLFTIAGISSAYALGKRSGKAYAKERISKLLIPLLSGIILIVPVQTYIADVFNNGYSGSYFDHYKVFFTKFTDLTGYDGGFTPAHTWFILYLFVISMISLPLLLWYNKQEKKIDGSRLTMPMILALFFPMLAMEGLGISGKSIGEALACFLIGFFFFSLDAVQDKLMKYRLPLCILWVLLMAGRVLLYRINIYSGIGWDMEQFLLTWFGILAILGLGKRYLNFHNKFTAYFSPAAFPIYYLHQSILIIIAFYILKVTDIIIVQFSVILILCFIITLLCYELFRRFYVTRFLFGIKKGSLMQRRNTTEVK